MPAIPVAWKSMKTNFIDNALAKYPHIAENTTCNNADKLIAIEKINVACSSESES